MLKILCAAATAFGLSWLVGGRAEAQIVTSYYAPPAAVVAPAPVVAAPVVAAPVASPIVGTIPVRRGLFGWRTESVPVLAPPAVVAPVAPVASLPVITETS